MVNIVIVVVMVCHCFFHRCCVFSARVALCPSVGSAVWEDMWATVYPTCRTCCMTPERSPSSCSQMHSRDDRPCRLVSIHLQLVIIHFIYFVYVVLYVPFFFFFFSQCWCVIIKLSSFDLLYGMQNHFCFSLILTLIGKDRNLHHFQESTYLCCAVNTSTVCVSFIYRFNRFSLKV